MYSWNCVLICMYQKKALCHLHWSHSFRAEFFSVSASQFFSETAPVWLCHLYFDILLKVLVLLFQMHLQSVAWQAISLAKDFCWVLSRPDLNVVLTTQLDTHSSWDSETWDWETKVFWVIVDTFLFFFWFVPSSCKCEIPVLNHCSLVGPTAF